MRQSRMGIGLAVLILAAGCASTTGVHRMTLLSERPIGPDPDRGTVCWLFYSFAEGELKRPIKDGTTVDLMYYWDKDDCSQGALLGLADRAGYLFPLGHRSWRQLAKATPPTSDAESIDAIAPLTKDKEGLAFWVKTKSGEHVLARIRKIWPATYAELMAGRVGMLELEWARPAQKTSGE